VLIAFASDYGLADEFAGVCKVVMLGIAPDAQIVDLSHEIPRHDVRAGALLLVRTVQYLPTDTIVVGVVDPGVGTDRRLVGIAVDGGILVGPDNGLLAPAVAMAGGAQRVVSLAGPYTLSSPGPTFAGRDVLAPAAGHLAAGVPLDELGEAIDPVGLVPGMVSLPETLAGGAVRGEVWWVDRFGNCQLNVDPGELEQSGARVGDRVELHLGSAEGTETIRVARWVRTYADAAPSEPALLVDSYGLLAVVFDRASAAQLLGLRTGSVVMLVPPGADPFTGGATVPSTVETPIDLGKRR
jgi:S-adenosyl-L-methionine hydrolase (adenosine-forming)